MAKQQLLWEDVEAGTELPTLPKVADSLMLVKWAGASGDFNPHHYEDTFARTQGTDGTIVHGLLKHAWLIQLVTGWMGDEGFLKKLSARCILFNVFGDTQWVGGKIANKFQEGDEYLVEIEISTLNQRGEQTMPGKALVSLPSKMRWV